MSNRYGLQVRAAAPADAPGIAELMGSAGHAVDASALADRLAAFRHEHGTALLAFEWGPPSGLIVLHWFQTLAADGLTARISTLLVNPADRRRGIARVLLKAAAQAARSAGCGTLHLPVAEGEPTLRAFAQASGFAEVATEFVRPLRKGAPRDDG